MGGVILGELSPVPPTVFCLQWPADITNDLVTFKNPRGRITNSDLEMAGLLLLWLCLEGVAPDSAHKHIALFGDNSPTASWTCFQFNTNVTTRMISTLQMKGITLAEWQRLPKIGKHIRKIGWHMSGLWDWTLIYRGCGTRQKCVSSRVLRQGSGMDIKVGESALQLARSLTLSRPLARRSRWPVATTQPR